MAITVRKATKEDAAKIAEFAVALFELHAAWDARRFTQIATRDGAERFYGDCAANGSVFVAESESRPVGFVYFEYEPTLYAELATRVLWLHDIYVEPDARGKGAGKALLAAVADEARKRGANKVLLSVAVQNAEGHEFFKLYGFETTMNEMMLGID